MTMCLLGERIVTHKRELPEPSEPQPSHPSTRHHEPRQHRSRVSALTSRENAPSKNPTASDPRPSRIWRRESEFFVDRPSPPLSFRAAVSFPRLGRPSSTARRVTASRTCSTAATTLTLPRPRCPAAARLSTVRPTSPPSLKPCVRSPRETDLALSRSSRPIFRAVRISPDSSRFESIRPSIHRRQPAHRASLRHLRRERERARQPVQIPEAPQEKLQV